MAVYKNINTDSRSIFASVDFDDVHNVAFSIVKNEVDVEKAKKILANAGEKFIAQSYVKGQTIIITQGQLNKKELFQKISTVDGDKFEIEKKKKPTSLEFIKEHGWKIRGGSSVVGQSATLFSSFKGVSLEEAKNPKTATPKFDPAVGVFSALNLAANLVNYVFGGQKEEDVKGLEKFDKIIADEVNHFLPKDGKKISPDDVHKLSYMNDKEIAEHNKDRSAVGVIKRNSVQLGEVGLRTIGSIALVLNFRKLGDGVKLLSKGKLKDAYLAAQNKDKLVRQAGLGMVAGKAMGLAAQTYDDKDPPTTYIGELRQKVLWRVSSFTEMVAQSVLGYDRHKNKKLIIGGKAHYDSTGVIGNAFNTVPAYPARLVLPYGQKVLDVPEVQARLLDELPKLPKDKIPEVAARVTSRMVEYLGEDSPDFSQIYKVLLEKLDKYHGLQALPHRVPERTALSNTLHGKSQEASKFVDKVQSAGAEVVKSTINKAKDSSEVAKSTVSKAKDRIKDIIKDGGAAVNHGHIAAAESTPSDSAIRDR